MLKGKILSDIVAVKVKVKHAERGDTDMVAAKMKVKVKVKHSERENTDMVAVVEISPT